MNRQSCRQFRIEPTNLNSHGFLEFGYRNQCILFPFSLLSALAMLIKVMVSLHLCLKAIIHTPSSMPSVEQRLKMCLKDILLPCSKKPQPIQKLLHVGALVDIHQGIVPEQYQISTRGQNFVLDPSINREHLNCKPAHCRTDNVCFGIILQARLENHNGYPILSHQDPQHTN